MDRFVDNSGACSTAPGSQAQGVYHPTAEIRGTRSGLLRIRGDASLGGSGGPWFYTRSSTTRIVGVQTFIRDGAAGTGFVGGARVTEFRNWVIPMVEN